MSFNENQHKGNYFQQILYHSVELTYNNDIMRNYVFCNRFISAKMQIRETINKDIHENVIQIEDLEFRYSCYR